MTIRRRHGVRGRAAALAVALSLVGAACASPSSGDKACPPPGPWPMPPGCGDTPAVTIPPITLPSAASVGPTTLRPAVQPEMTAAAAPSAAPPPGTAAAAPPSTPPASAAPATTRLSLTVVVPYWTTGDVYFGIAADPVVAKLERVNVVTFRGMVEVPAAGEYFFTRGTLASRSTTTFKATDLPRGIHAVVDWVDSSKRIARPGFMKGAIFGGMLWRPEELAIPGIVEYNLDLMRAAGYEWIGIVNTWYGFPDCREGVTEIKPYYATDGPWPDTQGWSTPTLTDAQVKDIVAQAKARGFKVMFKPIITSFANGPDRPWGCHTAPKIGWDKWFADYTNLATHFGRLAQETGVELFAIATELDLASSPAMAGLGAPPDATARVRKIIAAVRAVYSGKLTWSVACIIGSAPNWDPWPCRAPRDMQFWDALDYIGFEPYFPVTFKNDPTVAELKAGFAAAMDSLSLAKQLSERYGKPVVFTEYAPLAYDGANRDQQNRPAAPNVDEQEQTDQFEATFQAIEERSWIVGTFPWAWYLLKPGDDLAWHRTDVNVFNGRPGGKVVEKWYRKIDSR